ncbi:hypothetical protein AF335_07345 [Streptomyces eurocidicus]|uniref:Uncharacterized protein n=1 Tax=Streptomyces eurocidicus TaxID=66423 RepID=A0A2N8P085_STREU|nr:hypothetical protein [Streptomyces eurocidicus]MBB5118951.1 hypothetical protein [Streptomyces eurocidicus]MBF6051244.1 hypothetical protein [Streptomyces eurocidicus]PNE34409.1 hypothetical protein AF335_07345 [Streptomyces eurocidicus]
MVVTSYAQIPALLVDFAPEAASLIEEEADMPLHEAVRDDDFALGYFNLIGNVLSSPLLMPQLRAEDPDRDLVARCLAFVEKLMESPEDGVRSAAHFQCLEPLLDADGLLKTALPFMRERTREEAAKMVRFYAVEVDDDTRRQLGL